MNIKSRINARKLVLTYFYEKLFVEVFSQKQNILDDVFKTEKDINYKDTSDSEKLEIQNVLLNYYNISQWEDDIEYLSSWFFLKESADGIDFEYIKNIISYYNELEAEIIQKVDENSSTFKFHEMDLIDRAIFFIGYIEFNKLGTDRNVVLNEMIELAKRYGDTGSPKLINGVLHKILN